MKHLLKVFVVLALLALSGCVDDPPTARPTVIMSTIATPTAAATHQPTAESPTPEPSTLLPPTETATPPPKLDPATLAPVTRGPSTEEPPTRAPLTPQPTMPGPAATETPPATKPHLPLPGPASPTAEGSPIPPLLGSPQPETPPEWTTYEDPDYGFTFRYPAERWTALYQADDPNGLTLVYHDMGIALRMRFKRGGETADLQLYGGAAGDFTAHGTIRFLGKEVERTALVYQRITTRVFYNETSPIPRGDMLFSFALISNRDTPAVVLLPDDVQAEADRILESFVISTR